MMQTKMIAIAIALGARMSCLLQFSRTLVCLIAIALGARMSCGTFFFLGGF